MGFKNPGNSSPSSPVPGGGVAAPVAFATRVLLDADKNANLICATPQVATLNTGLAAGFSPTFKGIVTFGGTATLTDERSTGATYPFCQVWPTGVNTYSIVGSKP